MPVLARYIDCAQTLHSPQDDRALLTYLTTSGLLTGRRNDCARTTSGMTVTIDSGELSVVFTKTSQEPIWAHVVVSDSQDVTFDGGSGSDRYDALVLEIFDDGACPAITADAQNGANIARFQAVRGATASAMTDNEITTALGHSHWLRIDDVSIPASATVFGVGGSDASLVARLKGIMASTAIESFLDRYAVATGSADAYVIAFDTPDSGYVTGRSYRFKANFTNTTSTPTLNANGWGAKSLKVSGNLTPAIGHFYSGAIYEAVYDGTNLQVMSAVHPLAGVGDNYGDGSDGALSVTSGTTTIDCGSLNVVIKQYTSVNIAVGATLAFSNVPANGVIFVMLCQGNCTIAGTIDLSNCGADGGAGVTQSTTISANQAVHGNNGTNAFNHLGQTRNGGKGEGITGTDGSHVTDSSATGGGGAANPYAAGTATAAAATGFANAGGGTAGVAITLALAALGARGILVAPGSGGASGGIAFRSTNTTSFTGTYTQTSASGGKGGGALFAMIGGNLSFTGTLNLSGQNASNSSTSQGTVGGTNRGCSWAAGGSSGGAAGTAAAVVRGTITNSGTVTATAGTPGTGNSGEDGTGDGSTSNGNHSNGGVSAAGAFVVTPSA